MGKRKTEKPIIKTSILLTDISRVDGAMYAGLEITCHDKTVWRALNFKIGKFSIIGEFTKHED